MKLRVNNYDITDEYPDGTRFMSIAGIVKSHEGIEFVDSLQSRGKKELEIRICDDLIVGGYFVKEKKVDALIEAAKAYRDTYKEYRDLSDSIGSLKIKISELTDELSDKEDALINLEYPQTAFEALRRAALEYKDSDD